MKWQGKNVGKEEKGVAGQILEHAAGEEKPEKDGE